MTTCDFDSIPLPPRLASNMPDFESRATVRLLKATVAHLMARMSITEVPLPTLADGFHEPDIEIIKLPGIYMIRSKVHVRAEAGS